MAARLDSSFVMMMCSAYAFTRLAGSRYAHMLPGLLVSPVLVTPNLLSDFLPLPNWTLFVSLTFTALTPVCTCSPFTCIYTGLEMGTIPIFNLLCNHPSVVTCEIPRTLARPL